MDETSYWVLHGQGVAAVETVRWSEAVRLFAAAEAEARRLGNRTLADRAFCNQAAVHYKAPVSAAVRDGLTRILGASPDAKARQLAAYNLAVVFRREGRLKAAALYTETAQRLARSLGERSLQASALDFLGLLRVQEGHTKQGADLFERSLEAREGESAPRVLTLSTLAYCLSVAGRQPEALRRLEEGLEIFDRCPSAIYELPIRLNAGYTLLEAGEPEAALANGRRALDRCPPEGSGDEGKYALYLVGEALARQGERREAKEQFVLLQRRYYSQISDLPEVLLSRRTHSFLNWLA